MAIKGKHAPRKGVRSPTSHRTPEQMRKHYDEYQGRPEQIAKRSMRNAARRKVGKEDPKAIKGKDVHHERPLRAGGTNTRGNLKISSRKSNRGWKK